MKLNSVLFKISIWLFVFVFFVFLGTQIAVAQDWICTATYSYKSCNPSCGPPACVPTAPCCSCMECLCVGCIETYGECCNCTDPSQACGGCFTGETGVNINSQDSSIKTQKISELKEGDVVESFNPETGEIKEGTVSDVTKTTREGYYELETESGKKVKVTGEHPFLAIKAKNSESRVSPAGRDPASRDTFQLIDKFKNVLSNTLTYKLITGLQAKVSEVLK